MGPGSADNDKQRQEQLLQQAVRQDQSLQAQKQQFQVAQQQQQQQPLRDVDLSGLWVKDEGRSDLEAYERSLDMLGLSGLQKVTAKLIDGLELKQASGRMGAFVCKSLCVRVRARACGVCVCVYQPVRACGRTSTATLFAGPHT